MLRIFFIAMLILGVSIAFAEGQEKEGSAGDVILYPAKVVKEGAEVVVEAGKNVVETVGGTAEGIVTGDVEKAVTTPIKGAGKAVVDVVEGTVTAPVDAAKKEGEDELHPEFEEEAEQGIPAAQGVSQTQSR